MARIRVLIGRLPQILREIIATALSDAGVQIVTAESGETLLGALARMEVDAVILGLHDPTGAAEIDEVLSRHPMVRLLGIANGGRSAHLFELRPHREALGELSPRRLVSVLRTAGLAIPLSRRGSPAEGADVRRPPAVPG